MTSNNNLKVQARAYAAQHGVSYTQARREVLAAATGGGGSNPDMVTGRMFTIQQPQREDGVLPYPFHVDEHGFVGRQDFWRGEPFRLVGFTTSPEVYSVSLHAEDLPGDPQAAVGMHPVFMDRENRFATYPGAVESVTETETEVGRLRPDLVSARVESTDGKFAFTVGVGHLMWLLHDRDFDREGRMVKPETRAEMLGWLVADPGGQDLTDLFAMLDHTDSVAEFPEDGLVDRVAGLVSVTFDEAGVAHFLSPGSVR